MRHATIGYIVAVLVLILSHEVPAASVDYSLKQDSKVSVAIYDQSGQIVRQLLMGVERKTGEHTEPWDGLDDKGRPAPAGAYTWRLLSTQGLHAQWVATLGSGLNPGYQIMPGNHVGAVNVTLADNGDVIIMGGNGEVTPAMNRVTRTGKALWYSSDLIESNNDCGSGIAGGKLFSLMGNAKLIALDPASGKGFWKATTSWNNVKEVWLPGSGVISLAARGDQLVIANKDLNSVQWLSTDDGSKIDEAMITAPAALAIGGDGAVYAISGASVVKFTRNDKTPRTVVEGLTAAVRLAVSPESGEFFVAQAGESNQVRRFNAAGKLLATYGKPGGRRYGKYDPQDFRGVSGITADNDGGFIVVESNAAPRRTAFFDKNGKILHEWYGGVHYANSGAGDPDDASIAWFHSGSGEVVKAKIDFVARNYRVLETYKLIGLGDVIAQGNSMDLFYVRRYHGRTYLISGSIEPRMVMVDEQHDRLVPLVAGKYFLMHDFANPKHTPRPFVEAYFDSKVPAELKYGSITDAKNREAVIWTDLNGDGLPQNDEMVFSPRTLMTWSCGRVFPDDEGNLYEMNERPMRFEPKRWTAGGAPVYGGWTDWKPLGEKVTAFDPLKVGWPAGSGLIPMPDGSVIAFFNSTENPFGKGIGSDSLGGNYVVKWNKDGKIAWTTGFHSPDFGAAPGEARFFWNFAGQAHNCVVITDQQCYYTIKNLVYVWDTDGLWVDQLLGRPDLQSAPEAAYSLCTENFGGTLLEITEKNKAPGLNVGDVLFYGCGQNATVIYRVTGWDAFKRQSGKVALTEKETEAAKTEAFKYAARKGSAGKLSKLKKFAAAPLPRFAVAPVLDGKLGDPAWKHAGVIDDLRLAPSEEDPEAAPTTVLAAYDDQNLYFAVRCVEPQMDKLRAIGSPIHMDDSVELFIDPGCTRSHYFQVIVNPKGQYMIGEGSVARPLVKLTTRSGVVGDAWVTEVVVPWKEINAAPPKPGDRIGFNAVRNRIGAGESHSGWSPLKGNLNHSPHLFGTLYVGDALPREAIALREGRAYVRKLADGFKLDGDINKWRGGAPIRIFDGAKPVADVYLGYKADGLYAAFDVTTHRPWKNAASAEMAFNGGACVDLNLAPKDAQAKMAPGSARYIASPSGDKARLVEFLAKLTSDLSDKDKAPRTFHTTAQGDAAFDRLVELPDGSAIAKPRSDGSGYIVEFHMPLHPPMKLVSGERFKLDASVILANKEGTRAELRLPWFSTSGDDMFVATDEVVESTLRPANWGEAELE